MKINEEKLKEADSEGIRLIILFGSQADKSAHSESDYDVAVLTDDRKNIRDFDNYSKVLFFLREALGIPDYKIDLTNINEANPLLLHEIFSKSALIYGNQDIFDEYRAFAFRTYIDAKPLLELEDYLIKKRQLFLNKIIANKC
ncbi:MAG: nucleotidyltransferase domain-containing protein [Parcubacteria group bacterium]